MGFVLGAMGEHLHKIVNVTIVYPDGIPSFWDYISGRVKKVVVDIQVAPVTASLKGDYFGNDGFKDEFCQWLNRVWQEKDEKIAHLRTGNSRGIENRA